ncbi:MAG TPA: nucleotidyltransferase domain-containing protein [Methanoregulaceae archaeon]|nr:MAG: nucleotidyltransferase domain-containing protein [Methanolinea sp.]HON80662.1 nucleotidyltransferase domain-containing protein [Methanoregulaceae archaeon]HPD09396.1 nucleotidyltransferase domain-containing protein [Methanoregulaceae archaeon]HRT14811.1 nucleotidyltransferase domain-containing protein [Methanoregulaceae archaeon]HRU30384.1 nucleotidyltransferase domain-containing protein [Methanoregulaceae archaeon]
MKEQTAGADIREEVMVAINARFPAMRRLFGVGKIGIFGSCARGTMRPGSDVDIEVEFEPGSETWTNFIGLAHYLEELLGRRVDLVTRRVLEGYLSDDVNEEHARLNRDRVYLSRMAAECAFLRSRSKDLDFKAFSRDETLKRAAAWSVRVIGECAAHLSPERKQAAPGIPWVQLEGLQTRLSPPYFGPDWVLIWDLIDSGIPEMEPRIRDLVRQT